MNRNRATGLWEKLKSKIKRLFDLDRNRWVLDPVPVRARHPPRKLSRNRDHGEVGTRF